MELNSEPIIKIKNLSISFFNNRKSFFSSTANQQTILADFNKEIFRNQKIAILGPSGCGKSTLLNSLSGINTSFTGEIIKDPNLKVSYVFQEAALLPWRTVSENIQLPLETSKNKLQLQKSERNELITHYARLVGLDKYKDLYPHQLSGGMKMRVSIARALISQPDILFMDEPFGALDEITRHEIQEQFITKILPQKITLIFVTHSLSEAVIMSDLIWFFKKSSLLIQEIPISIPFQLKKESDFRFSDIYYRKVQELKNVLL